MFLKVSAASTVTLEDALNFRAFKVMVARGDTELETVRKRAGERRDPARSRHCLGIRAGVTRVARLCGRCAMAECPFDHDREGAPARLD